MPLFDFRCLSCGAVHEALYPSAEAAVAEPCRACGAATERVTVSRFGIAGARPKTSEASLGSSGADFMSNPDKFVTAMDTFGEKMGSPLTATEKERAVTRLEDAKK